MHLRDMAEGMQVQPATMAELATKLETATKLEPVKKLEPTKSGEATKLLYILVQDGPLPGAKKGEHGPTYRYTRGLLQSTLQLMGCKARHAVKVSGLLKLDSTAQKLTLSYIFKGTILKPDIVIVRRWCFSLLLNYC